MALTQIDDRGLKTPIDLLDNEKIRFGTGNDLELYHDGTASYIQDAGTGQLRIDSNAFEVMNAADSEYIIKTAENGGVELYYDNSKKFETESGGARVTGNLTVTTGNSILTNSSQGQLTVKGGATYPGGAIKFAGGQSGATDQGTIIFYAGTDTSLETRFRIQADGRVQIPNDSGKYECGSSGDLKIFHDGSHSRIHNDTGALILETDDSAIQINKGTTENMALFTPDGSVELYYDNSKKFETTSGGATVTGNLSATSNLLLADSVKARFGTGEDLEIYHDGTNSQVRNETGSLIVMTDTYDLRSYSSNETMIKGLLNGAVELYYNNTKTFNTDEDGAQVTGFLQSHLAIADSDYTAHDWHVLQSNYNNYAACIIEHSGDTDPFGLVITFTDDNPDDNSNYFITCTDTTNTRFKVFSDGDVVNNDNSYGATSDVKLKENIVDAGSQWDDIKAVKVRNFNFKTDTPSDKRLGVIAQELETVSPGLVSDNPDLDKDNNNLGTTTKSVKYSILYMKAIKALQEAMARIETLETEVAALKAK